MNSRAAPLFRRFLALGLDYLVILTYGLILLGGALMFYYFVFGGVLNVLDILGRAGSQVIGFVTLTLPIALYFYLTESGKRHATFGKQAMKLQVVKANGNTVTRKQIALRTLIKLLPWEFAHTFVYQVVYYSQDGGTPPVWVMAGLIIANLLPLLYIGTILIRKDHRGPHDLVAKTIVITS